MADTPTAYLDSSALVKLVIPEVETEALRRELGVWSRRVSSELSRAEVVRACVRVTPLAHRPALELVSELDLVTLSRELLDQAAVIEPLSLRMLDAIHLASALSLGDMVGVFFSYDDRLGSAARAAGLAVLAPA